MGAGKRPSNGNTKKKDGDTYSAKYLPMDLVDEIVFDAPDSHKTGALYSRTDLHKCMIDFLVEMLPDCGFVEHTQWSYIRLCLAIAAASIGTYSVLKLKYPKDKEWVMYMVIAFFAIHIFVNIMDTLIIGAESFYTLSDKNKKPVGCSLRLEEFSEEVVWTIHGSDKAIPTTSTKPVGNYFDSEGYLVVENLFDDFCGVLEEHCGELPIVWEARPDYNLEERKPTENKKKK